MTGTMGTFVADVVATLTTIVPDWEVLLMGAFILGSAVRFGPRLLKRFA